MDLQKYKQRLQEVKKQLENNEIDEIPLDARPKMLDFDFDKESFIVVSYSRKDFDKVYLFLAHLYNEGYRFWYDNGMKGTEKWLDEYKDKYNNPNCLGTITFFSDHYISNSTKEELTIIYTANGYVKRNVMISLVPLTAIDPEKVLISAIANGRITIPNASAILPLLTELIQEEKEKTIHRYVSDSDIHFLADKVGAAFQIRGVTAAKKLPDAEDFDIRDGELIKYIGSKTAVTVPEGVTSIKGMAFDGCESIVDLTIPDSVTSIGLGAFRNCSSLKSVKLPKGIPNIPMCAFDGCIALENVTIPIGVTEIGSDAFEDCRSLTRIMVPEGVTRIASGAFYNCAALSSITIPSSIKRIGSMVFFGCEALDEITFSGTKSQWDQVVKEDDLSPNIKLVKCIDGTIALL